MYSSGSQETVSSLHEAERLMNLSISKIQLACQHDLPLRRSILIASVLNRAQRAAADAIASLDCSKTQPPIGHCTAPLSLKSEEGIAHDDIEMHILGNDLLSEILCADDKPASDFELGEMSDNLRKRPREPVVMESVVKPPPLSEMLSETHDSKRLKEEGATVPLSEAVEDWSGLHPSYNDMWIMPNIWTTPVVC